MAYKLLHAAHDRWRRIRSLEVVPMTPAGAKFIAGQCQERHANPTDDDADEECTG